MDRTKRQAERHGDALRFAHTLNRAGQPYEHIIDRYLLRCMVDTNDEGRNNALSDFPKYFKSLEEGTTRSRLDEIK